MISYEFSDFTIRLKSQVAPSVSTAVHVNVSPASTLAGSVQLASVKVVAAWVSTSVLSMNGFSVLLEVLTVVATRSEQEESGAGRGDD